MLKTALLGGVFCSCYTTRMAIYFLRHSESQANVDKIFAGQKEDSPLTHRGIYQADAAGKELRTAGIKRIISSKLQRAHQTAERVAVILGVSEIEIDNRLLEYDMGALTATPHHTVTSLDLVAAEGAEDPNAFQHRVLSLLFELKQENEDILLVSHAGVGRIIEAARQSIAPNLFYDLPAYPNAHAVELELSWLA